MNKYFKELYSYFTDEEIEQAKQLIREKYPDQCEKNEKRVMNTVLPILLSMYIKDKYKEEDVCE